MNAIEMNQPPFVDEEFNGLLSFIGSTLSSRRPGDLHTLEGLKGFDQVALACKVLDTIETQIESFSWDLHSFTETSLTFNFQI